MEYAKPYTENNSMVRYADMLMHNGVTDKGRLLMQVAANFSVPDYQVERTLMDNDYDFNKSALHYYSFNDFITDTNSDSIKATLLANDLELQFSEGDNKLLTGMLVGAGTLVLANVISTLAIPFVKRGVSMLETKLATIEAAKKTKDQDKMVDIAISNIESKYGFKLSPEEVQVIKSKLAKNTNFSIPNKIKVGGAIACLIALSAVLAKIIAGRVNEKKLMTEATNYALEPFKGMEAGDITPSRVNDFVNRYIEYLAKYGIRIQEGEKQAMLTNANNLLADMAEGYNPKMRSKLFNENNEETKVMNNIDYQSALQDALFASIGQLANQAVTANKNKSNLQQKAAIGDTMTTKRNGAIDTAKKRGYNAQQTKDYLKRLNLTMSNGNFSYQDALQYALFADAQMQPDQNQQTQVVQDPNQQPQQNAQGQPNDQPQMVDQSQGQAPNQNQPQGNSEVSNLGDPNANYLPNMRIVDDKGNHGTIRTGNKLLKDSKGEFTGVEVYWDSGKCDWISTQLIGMEVTPVQNNDQQAQQPQPDQNQQDPNQQVQDANNQPDQNNQQGQPNQPQPVNQSEDSVYDWLTSDSYVRKNFNANDAEHNFGIITGAIGAVGKVAGGVAKAAGNAVSKVASTATNAVKSAVTTPNTNTNTTTTQNHSTREYWMDKINQNFSTGLGGVTLNLAKDDAAFHLADSVGKGVADGVTKALADAVGMGVTELLNWGRIILKRITNGDFKNQELNRESHDALMASIERLIEVKAPMVRTADKTIAARKNKLFLH
jgi:hypothetical protein